MQNRKLTLLGVSILLIAFASTEAVARMRDNVVVADTAITLGDFFDDAGERSDTVIGPAPLPGKQIAYRTDYLRSLAREHGLQSTYVPNRKFVMVTRDSDIVSNQRITDLITDAIIDAGIEDRFEIELTGRRNELHVPIGMREDTDISVEDLRFQRSDGRFHALLSASAGTSDAQQISVYGRIQILKTVPVLSRNFAKGEIISALDIDWIEMPVHDLRQNTVMSEGKMIGTEVKSNLQAGKPISHRSLRTPLMVKKGKLVTMSFRKSGLSLTIRGRAMADGSIGSVVPVINLQSKRTIHAEVISKDAVRVQIHGQIATATSN